MGLVTSVGHNAPAACAAIRAGIARPRGCGGYTSLELETQDSEPITGHPIRGYTEGFSGSGLWLRLARGALSDLFDRANLPHPSEVGFWRRTGILAVTASPEAARFQLESDGRRALEDAFLHPLGERLAVPLERTQVRLGGAAHAGTAQALEEAARLLSRGTYDRLLLVAVDSYLDALTLQWLDAAERLKTGDIPSGLSPGEAGACLLLESEESARGRGAAPLCVLAGVATAREPQPTAPGEPSTGQGLSRCIREAMKAAGISTPYAGDVYSDLNGEAWRAHEWGSAVVRLTEQLGAVKLHLPCVSVGDVGAASGALGVCLASHALHRRHTKTDRALVISSAMDGNVGCIALSALPQRS